MNESVQGSLEALRETLDRLAGEDMARIGTPPGARDPGDLRWSALDAQVEVQLAGQRVLAIGSGAGDDALAFAARGAQYVLACTPLDAPQHTERTESIDQSIVDFRTAGWEALDPRRDGTFDVVHCNDLLHRVLEPMTLLRTLRRMTSSDGTLLIRSMMLGDRQQSEFLRFIPDRHAGDPTWWFVPGRLAFRWLVETAGFGVEAEFGEIEGPRDSFPVMAGYLRARAQE